MKNKLVAALTGLVVFAWCVRGESHPAVPDSHFGLGEFKAGLDIRPGVYHLAGRDNGYDCHWTVSIDRHGKHQFSYGDLVKGTQFVGVASQPPIGDVIVVGQTSWVITDGACRWKLSA